MSKAIYIEYTQFARLLLRPSTYTCVALPSEEIDTHAQWLSVLTLAQQLSL
jgi:hypothetical protein